MDTKEQVPLCQMIMLQRIPEKATLSDYFLQVVHRTENVVGRRWRFLIRSLTAARKERKDTSLSTSVTRLSPGDYVRVKTKEEIFDTLDSWNELRRCGFMTEMEVYCGTTQRVLKRVDRFIDERDFRAKRCKGIVLLEDVMCEGTELFGRCDRSCFFFWREEWLEKISQ